MPNVRLRNAISILERVYGIPKKGKPGNPVDALVRVILSQNTSDKNSSRAFSNLKQRFPSNALLLSASPRSIASAIRSGGLPNIKARRIKNALRAIKAKTGGLSLSFLSRLPTPEARDFLTSIKGVGPKSAAVLLTFSFNRPAFPVDTHVFRVSKRLGLVPKKFDRTKTQVLLDRLVPDSKKRAFHINLIQHGRTLCTARKPKCGRCPLYRMCPFGRKTYRGAIKPARKIISRWPGAGEIIA